MVNDDGFWMDAVRKLGSNHAVDGFDALEILINSYKLNEHELRSLAGSLRSLEGQARDRAAAVEAKRKRPWENENEPYPMPIEHKVGRPRTIPDMKAYKAAKAREYRAKKKEG